MKKVFKFFTLFGLALSGCASITGYKSDISSYENQVLNQDCEFSQLEDDKIYNGLKDGMRARICKNYKISNQYFDIVEDEFKKSVDLQGYFSLLSNSALGAVTNENALDYKGAFYQRSLVNIYKALNYMSQNDFQSARVELNRTLQREQRAKEYYNDEINKASKELDEFQKFKNINPKNEQNSQEFIQNYTKIDNFTPYKDFINPFTFYISGLFFSIIDDKKGIYLLKECARISNSAQAKKDYEWAKNKKDKRVFLIYENGKTMGLKESKFDIPFFIFSDHLYHIGLALPKLSASKDSFKFLKINGEKTNLIANMDNIIKSEFEKTAKIRATKAILNAATKASLQYGASQIGNDNALGAIFGMYSILTNKADIRYIPTFAKDFQSASIKNTGEIDISDDEANQIFTSKVDKDKNIIIYVKSLTKNFFVTDIITF